MLFLKEILFLVGGGKITSYTGEYTILFTAVLSMVCRQEFCVKLKINATLKIGYSMKTTIVCPFGKLTNSDNKPFAVICFPHDFHCGDIHHNQYFL